LVTSLALEAGFASTETTGEQGVMRLEKTLEPPDYKRRRTVFEFVIDNGVGRP
jgi:hypothetical protein